MNGKKVTAKKILKNRTNERLKEEDIAGRASFNKEE